MRTCEGSCRYGYRSDRSEFNTCGDAQCENSQGPCSQCACYFAADGACIYSSQTARDAYDAQTAIEAASSVSDRIVTDRPRHLHSDAAYAEVAATYGVDGASEISDACALTIASWWQAPSGHGLTFAELSTTGSVSAEALADAIASEYMGATPPDRKAFDCLSTWAVHHESRTA